MGQISIPPPIILFYFAPWIISAFFLFSLKKGLSTFIIFFTLAVISTLAFVQLADPFLAPPTLITLTISLFFLWSIALLIKTLRMRRQAKLEGPESLDDILDN